MHWLTKPYWRGIIVRFAWWCPFMPDRIRHVFMSVIMDRRPLTADEIEWAHKLIAENPEWSEPDYVLKKPYIRVWFTKDRWGRPVRHSERIE